MLSFCRIFWLRNIQWKNSHQLFCYTEEAHFRSFHSKLEIDHVISLLQVIKVFHMFNVIYMIQELIGQSLLTPVFTFLKLKFTR